ncbi:RNA-binding S4 domain-containing protein [Methyloceanibacter sp.]|uniref:RNA-binding S4 domain-containing protein n=1 Tax=Methyloceanibacter sp. TaxID=1965321 RepID=UPI002D2C7F3F|nr:RNA-binding S4 domain-containing protein [Methyloceanibacter sp.]HZP09088.1 RNA-binding S4 domain-containing protein [Methyloceanibacter sp.]
MIGQRLDKWLWCARVVKTRAAAVRLIVEGKVRINGVRALKASRPVHHGDVITAMALGRLSVLRVVGTAERRGPASAALALYDDLTPKALPGAEPGDGAPVQERGPRPTKRDRRRLDALHAKPSES